MFHSLRHSGSAMKLLYTGGDIQGVKESNGQSTSRMVTEQYGHLFRDSAAVIANKLEEIFFPDRRATGKKRPELMELILVMGHRQKMIVIAKNDSTKEKAFGGLLFISSHCGEECGRFFLKHIDTVSKRVYNEHTDTVSALTEARRV